MPIKENYVRAPLPTTSCSQPAARNRLPGNATWKKKIPSSPQFPTDGSLYLSRSGSLYLSAVAFTLLAILVPFLSTVLQAGGGRLQIHAATESPSGIYRVASKPIDQVYQDNLRGEIGSVISLIDKNGAVLSQCFRPFPAYQDTDRDDWRAKAYWNNNETMTAISSAGHLFAKVDFYSVAKDRIAILPHPEWEFILFKDLKGYKGERTRTYETFKEWLTEDTCVVEVSGTAVLDETQKDRYPDYSYTITIRIAMDRIEILAVKKE